MQVIIIIDLDQEMPRGVHATRGVQKKCWWLPTLRVLLILDKKMINR